MRAACCEATVLRHEVIADDIRLLTALWPDREHAPHAGQFFTLRAWGADEAPFLSRAHQRPQVGCRDPDRRVPVRRRGRGDPQADGPGKKG